MNSLLTAPPLSDFEKAFSPTELEARVAATAVTIQRYRALRRWAQAWLSKAFRAGAPADDLVHGRARFVDALLRRAWTHHLGEHASSLALVAVGGYGRGELLPHSDVDVLILHRGPDLVAGDRAALERYIAFLWDIGLDVGHSVRTPKECAQHARADITVMTNLLEARPLSGDKMLLRDVRRRCAQRHLWPARPYFEAKLKEQEERYLKYRDTAYHLEPNVKESPGGLRDIHVIVWTARRLLAARSLHELVAYGFLTEDEHTELLNGRAFLWRVRFALHMLSGRREDRLLFDHQIRVAEMLGYTGDDTSLAVEQLMQDYYRTVQALSCLNDMLLQLFREAIVHAHETAEPQPLTRRFRSRHGYIEARRDNVFRRYPFALLEVFHTLQQHPELEGIRAETIRLIRRDRVLIDDRFRQDIRARSLFMDILREPHGVTRALRRMHRYGVLDAYLPAFAHITGRMQYDLFHTLTVDEHILFVVRNMRRLALPRFDHELPFCSRIMQQLPKPELLYLAGLFHDIAKGRGGDHSDLGARDAREFCAAHGLATWDCDLVSWLVQHHLLMSTTAQKRDIADPKVIHDFARTVGEPVYLDYLFLLTVCDIRATNPSLWNSWRENLLTDLYRSTRRAFERGLHNPVQEPELIRERQMASKHLLHGSELEAGDVDRVWTRLDDDYFLRNSAEEIAWQTRAIMATSEAGLPLVLVRNVAAHGTMVFVYAADVDYFFGLSTGVLAQIGLSILEARISGTRDGYALNTYIVTESNGNALIDEQREAEIRHALVSALRDPRSSGRTVSQRRSRRLRYFSTPTQVHFSQDADNQRTLLELVTGDRPGLLSTVGEVFRRRRVLVHAAKINTIGERAEDVFFITDAQHQPITDTAALDQLRRTLIQAVKTEST